MSIWNILLSYDGTGVTAHAGRLSAVLARRYDEQLSGVLIDTVRSTNVPMETCPTEAPLATQTEEPFSPEFHDIIGKEKQGLATSFDCRNGFANDVLARMDRAHNLIVTTQPEEGVVCTSVPRPIALRCAAIVMCASRRSGSTWHAVQMFHETQSAQPYPSIDVPLKFNWRGVMPRHSDPRNRR